MREARCSQIWAGFGGGLSADTSLLHHHSNSCSVFHHWISPFPRWVLPGRDSDTVESMRHKLGELTDLHGLKRLVLGWPQGC